MGRSLIMPSTCIDARQAERLLVDRAEFGESYQYFAVVDGFPQDLDAAPRIVDSILYEALTRK